MMQDYEKKIEKAKKLLDKLSSDLTLHESMKIYKEGLKTIEEATEILEKAKLEFEEIKS
jgi:exodeoxyribonuclease VII small subunit